MNDAAADLGSALATVIIAGITVRPAYKSCMEEKGYTEVNLPISSELSQAEINLARNRAQQAQQDAEEEQKKAVAASQKAALQANPPEGYGRITYTSGAYYLGEISNGERNGYGVFVYKEGRDEGKFSHNRPIGAGVLVAANGDRYEGEFRGGPSGFSAGYAVYTWADGRHYEGEFANDQPTGVGVLIDAHGASHAGLWKDGKLIQVASPNLPASPIK